MSEELTTTALKEEEFNKKVDMKGSCEEESIDFLTFSAHKAYAPFGSGAIVGRKDYLNSNKPFLSGGGCVAGVFDEEVIWTSVPEKFEAGTQNVEAAVGLSKAIDYLNEIGYGALMGLLHNYEVLNPIVTCTNDGFERLVPGFEAPVCIVTSLGHTYEIPSRNRSVLVGLIRDAKNPKSLRFELRSPNPLSNTYLVIAGCYQTMLDGIIATAKSKLTTKELEKEISKGLGEDSFYLEKNRVYRDENDVFEDYNEEERRLRFGEPPATVYENMKNFDKYEEKLRSLKNGNVFTDSIIDSFRTGAIDKWKKELRFRIIHDHMDRLRGYVKLHTKENMDALDEVNWNAISELKTKIMKDTLTNKCSFTKIIEAIERKDYETVSNLQKELSNDMKMLQSLYIDYAKNIF